MSTSRFVVAPSLDTPLSQSDSTARLRGSVDAQTPIPILDGIRGLAILLVMIHHLTIMEARISLDHVFIRIAQAGWVGVDLFFVLSGFLITGILYDSKNSRSYFSNFYARRVLRIFPLYYGVLFFSLIILPHLSHPKLMNFGRIAGDEVWYWLYLSNYSIAFAKAFRHGILDVSWSLAIEEQFYLLWPAIVFLSGRHRLMKICIGVIVTAMTFRTLLVLTRAHPIAIYVLTPARMDSLAVGAWVALAARGEGGLGRWKPAARVVTVLSGLAWCGTLAWGNFDYLASSLVQCLGYTVVALFFGSMLVLTLGSLPSARTVRILSHPVLTLFGQYSYALYLFHLPLRAAIRDTVFGPTRFFTLMDSQLPGQVAFYLLATAAALGLAALSWNLYEKHFLKLKVFFPLAKVQTSHG
jgi:peptidoglycan/LPS O-acetylase OafA/YrhL